MNRDTTSAQLTRLVVGLFLSASVAVGASSEGETVVPPEDVARGYASGWFMVRLAEPLDVSADGGELSLATGRPELDRAIRTAGVIRIERGLSWTGADREARARLGFDRLYKFHVPVGADVQAAVSLFAQTAGVDYAEPDFVGHGAATFPNDARFGDQWGMHQASNHDVNAPEAWDVSTGSSAIVIAMLDTGVDFYHEEFAGKTVPGWDFVNNDSNPQDDHGHGSNTASVAAARTGNFAGIAGTCWNCLIMPLKNLDANNSGYYSWWASSLTWAADHGAEIASMSEGGISDSTTLHNAIRYAYDAGLVIPACMMNANNAVPYYPAAYSETIAVGGTDQLDRRASPFCWGGGSNYGSHIDVVAPGDLILGAARGGGYNTWCGTSQATPIVSGLAGLIESLDPGAGREEIRHLTRSGAVDRVGRSTEDTAGFDVYMGYGRVDMRRTLDAAVGIGSLRVSGATLTRPYLATPISLATSYDFIRGDLSALSETSGGVALGTVTCLADNLAAPDTGGGHEDTTRPDPGRGFFYLARFNAAPGAGSYGGSSLHRDRGASAGDCSK